MAFQRSDARRVISRLIEAEIRRRVHICSGADGAGSRIVFKCRSYFIRTTICRGDSFCVDASGGKARHEPIAEAWAAVEIDDIGRLKDI